MYLKLRVFFTILSALCLVFALTAGALWGYIWAIVLGLAALLFYLLMRVFKQSQENQEQKEAEEKKFFTHTPDDSPMKQNEDEENKK